jgi:hypothetical protein
MPNPMPIKDCYISKDTLWIFDTATLKLMEQDALAVAEQDANSPDCREIASCAALLIGLEIYSRDKHWPGRAKS